MNKDNRLLAEAYENVIKKSKIGDITNFKDLPDNKPYGFCVYYDGSVDAVYDRDHEEALKRRGFKSYDDFYSKGCVRVVYESEFKKFYLMGDLNNTNSRIALKVAKDIAAWYQAEYDLDVLTPYNGTYIMD